MKKIKQFLTNPRGSVTVEFIFIFFLFSVLLIFLIDVTILQSTTGKVQRTSYSLLNVVKERSAVYKGDEKISSAEVEKLKTLALSLMGEEKTSDNVAVTIEHHQFNDIQPQTANTPATRPEKKVNVTQFSSGSGSCTAAGAANIADASPLTQNFRGSVRYASIYRVTVCRKMTNLFKGLSLSEKDQVSGWIRATAIGVSR